MFFSIIIFFFCNFLCNFFWLIIFYLSINFILVLFIISFIGVGHDFILAQFWQSFGGVLLRILIGLLLGSDKLFLNSVELGLTINLAVRHRVFLIIRFFFFSVSFFNLVFLISFFSFLFKRLEVFLAVCINFFRILLNLFHLSCKIIEIRLW